MFLPSSCGRYVAFGIVARRSAARSGLDNGGRAPLRPADAFLNGSAMKPFLVRPHALAAAASALSCMLLGAPSPAGAQGFGLNEIGTCAVGRTSAGAAAPCADGSAIFWNPAATTRLTGTLVSLGVSAISVKGGFTQDTTGIEYPGDVPVRWPPYLFANYKLGARTALGLGVYVPYGLTSQWEANFPGRFSAQKAELQTLYVQPNVAYEVVPGRLSIGGGPIYAHSSVELIQAVDLSQQVATRTPATITFAQLGIPSQTEFAQGKLKGSADAWGFQVGVHAQVTPDIALGARYLSKVSMQYDDLDASFTQVSTGLVLAANNPLSLPAGTPIDAVVAPQFTGSGALTPQKASTAIDHPAQVQAGIAYTGLDRTTVMVDYEWIQWSSFETLPVTFHGGAAASSRTLIEDYDDSNSIRSAIEHEFHGWSARLGFTFTGTPAPDQTVTPLLPDMDRYIFATGISVPFAGRFTFDAGYLRVETEGRRGRTAEFAVPACTGTSCAPPGSAPPNNGFFSLGADIFSVGLRAHF
jgi:long-chain fatty acid transport protein